MPPYGVQGSLKPIENGFQAACAFALRRALPEALHIRRE